MTPWRVPLFEPDFGALEEQAVLEPLRSQWVTAGEITARLETEFAARCGVAHAIAVTNCTAALHLAVLAAGIGPGDEVLVPTLTFVATANAVRYAGAQPVFCDSRDETDLNVDIDQMAARITQRTKAVIVVHYAGFPVDMTRVEALAAEHGLTVIEDCAHALFSTLRGRRCGAWGLAGCFSFFGNKNITCGEGGMITTNDDELAARLRRMRSHGMTTVTLDRFKGRAFSYDVLDLGFNYRMEDLRSALALAQLSRLDGFLQERARVRRRYCERLEGSTIGVPDFGWSRIAQDGDSVGHHIMPVVLPESVDRREVADALRRERIQSSLHYRPVHTFSAFASDDGGGRGLERTESLSARELTLPMYPSMSDDDVDVVCDALLGATQA